MSAQDNEPQNKQRYKQKSLSEKHAKNKQVSKLVRNEDEEECTIQTDNNRSCLNLSLDFQKPPAKILVISCYEADSSSDEQNASKVSDRLVAQGNSGCNYQLSHGRTNQSRYSCAVHEDDMIRTGESITDEPKLNSQSYTTGTEESFITYEETEETVSQSSASAQTTAKSYTVSSLPTETENTSLERANYKLNIPDSKLKQVNIFPEERPTFIKEKFETIREEDSCTSTNQCSEDISVHNNLKQDGHLKNYVTVYTSRLEDEKKEDQTNINLENFNKRVKCPCSKSDLEYCCKKGVEEKQEVKNVTDKKLSCFLPNENICCKEIKEENKSKNVTNKKLEFECKQNCKRSSGPSTKERDKTLSPKRSSVEEPKTNLSKKIICMEKPATGDTIIPKNEDKLPCFEGNRKITIPCKDKELNLENFNEEEKSTPNLGSTAEKKLPCFSEEPGVLKKCKLEPAQINAIQNERKENFENKSNPSSKDSSLLSHQFPTEIESTWSKKVLESNELISPVSPNKISTHHFEFTNKVDEISNQSITEKEYNFIDFEESAKKPNSEDCSCDSVKKTTVDSGFNVSELHNPPNTPVDTSEIQVKKTVTATASFDMKKINTSFKMETCDCMKNDVKFSLISEEEVVQSSVNDESDSKNKGCSKTCRCKARKKKSKHSIKENKSEQKTVIVEEASVIEIPCVASTDNKITPCCVEISGNSEDSTNKPVKQYIDQINKLRGRRLTQKTIDLSSIKLPIEIDSEEMIEDLQIATPPTPKEENVNVKTSQERVKDVAISEKSPFVKSSESKLVACWTLTQPSEEKPEESGKPCKSEVPRRNTARNSDIKHCKPPNERNKSLGESRKLSAPVTRTSINTKATNALPAKSKNLAPSKLPEREKKTEDTPTASPHNRATKASSNILIAKLPCLTTQENFHETCCLGEEKKFIPCSNRSTKASMLLGGEVEEKRPCVTIDENSEFCCTDEDAKRHKNKRKNKISTVNELLNSEDETCCPDDDKKIYISSNNRDPKNKLITVPVSGEDKKPYRSSGINKNVCCPEENDEKAEIDTNSTCCPEEKDEKVEIAPNSVADKDEEAAIEIENLETGVEFRASLGKDEKRSIKKPLKHGKGVGGSSLPKPSKDDGVKRPNNIAPTKFSKDSLEKRESFQESTEEAETSSKKLKESFYEEKNSIQLSMVNDEKEEQGKQSSRCVSCCRIKEGLEEDALQEENKPDTDIQDKSVVTNEINEFCCDEKTSPLHQSFIEKQKHHYSKPEKQSKTTSQDKIDTKKKKADFGNNAKEIPTDNNYVSPSDPPNRKKKDYNTKSEKVAKESPQIKTNPTKKIDTKKKKADYKEQEKSGYAKEAPANTVVSEGISEEEKFCCENGCIFIPCKHEEPPDKSVIEATQTVKDGSIKDGRRTSALSKAGEGKRKITIESSKKNSQYESGGNRNRSSGSTARDHSVEENKRSSRISKTLDKTSIEEERKSQLSDTKKQNKVENKIPIKGQEIKKSKKQSLQESERSGIQSNNEFTSNLKKCQNLEQSTNDRCEPGCIYSENQNNPQNPPVDVKTDHDDVRYDDVCCYEDQIEKFQSVNRIKTICNDGMCDPCLCQEDNEIFFEEKKTLACSNDSKKRNYPTVIVEVLHTQCKFNSDKKCCIDEASKEFCSDCKRSCCDHKNCKNVSEENTSKLRCLNKDEYDAALIKRDVNDKNHLCCDEKHSKKAYNDSAPTKRDVNDKNHMCCDEKDSRKGYNDSAPIKRDVNDKNHMCCDEKDSRKGYNDAEPITRDVNDKNYACCNEKDSRKAYNDAAPIKRDVNDKNHACCDEKDSRRAYNDATPITRDVNDKNHVRRDKKNSRKAYNDAAPFNNEYQVRSGEKDLRRSYYINDPRRLTFVDDTDPRQRIHRDDSKRNSQLDGVRERSERRSVSRSRRPSSSRYLISAERYSILHREALHLPTKGSLPLYPSDLPAVENYSRSSITSKYYDPDDIAETQVSGELVGSLRRPVHKIPRHSLKRSRTSSPQTHESIFTGNESRLSAKFQVDTRKKSKKEDNERKQRSKSEDRRRSSAYRNDTPRQSKEFQENESRRSTLNQFNFPKQSKKYQDDTLRSFITYQDDKPRKSFEFQVRNQSIVSDDDEARQSRKFQNNRRRQSPKYEDDGRRYSLKSQEDNRRLSKTSEGDERRLFVKCNDDEPIQFSNEFRQAIKCYDNGRRTTAQSLEEDERRSIARYQEDERGQSTKFKDGNRSSVISQVEERRLPISCCDDGFRSIGISPAENEERLFLKFQGDEGRQSSKFPVSSRRISPIPKEDERRSIATFQDGRRSTVTLQEDEPRQSMKFQDGRRSTVTLQADEPRQSMKFQDGRRSTVTLQEDEARQSMKFQDGRRSTVTLQEDEPRQSMNFQDGRKSTVTLQEEERKLPNMCCDDDRRSIVSLQEEERRLPNTCCDDGRRSIVTLQEEERKLPNTCCDDGRRSIVTLQEEERRLPNTCCDDGRRLTGTHQEEERRLPNTCCDDGLKSTAISPAEDEERLFLKFQGDEGIRSTKFPVSSRRISPVPKEDDRRSIATFQDDERRQSMKFKDDRRSTVTLQEEERRMPTICCDDDRRLTLTPQEEERRLPNTCCYDGLRSSAIALAEDEERSHLKFQGDEGRQSTNFSLYSRRSSAMNKVDNRRSIDKFQEDERRQSFKFQEDERRQICCEDERRQICCEDERRQICCEDARRSIAAPQEEERNLFITCCEDDPRPTAIYLGEDDERSLRKFQDNEGRQSSKFSLSARKLSNIPKEDERGQNIKFQDDSRRSIAIPQEEERRLFTACCDDGARPSALSLHKFQDDEGRQSAFPLSSRGLSTKFEKNCCDDVRRSIDISPEEVEENSLLKCQDDEERLSKKFSLSNRRLITKPEEIERRSILEAQEDEGRQSIKFQDSRRRSSTTSQKDESTFIKCRDNEPVQFPKYQDDILRRSTEFNDDNRPRLIAQDDERARSTKFSLSSRRRSTTEEEQLKSVPKFQDDGRRLSNTIRDERGPLIKCYEDDRRSITTSLDEVEGNLPLKCQDDEERQAKKISLSSRRLSTTFQDNERRSISKFQEDEGRQSIKYQNDSRRLPTIPQDDERRLFIKCYDDGRRSITKPPEGDEERSLLEFQDDRGRQSSKFSLSSRRLSTTPEENERRQSTTFQDDGREENEGRSFIKCYNDGRMSTVKLPEEDQQKSHLKFQNDDGRQSGKFSISSRRQSPTPLENERRQSTQFHEDEPRQYPKFQEDEERPFIKCYDNGRISMVKLPEEDQENLLLNCRDDDGRQSTKFSISGRRLSFTPEENERRQSTKFQEDVRRQPSKFQDDDRRLSTTAQEDERQLFSKCRDDATTQFSKFRGDQSRQFRKLYDEGRRRSTTTSADERSIPELPDDERKRSSNFSISSRRFSPTHEFKDNGRRLSSTPEENEGRPFIKCYDDGRMSTVRLPEEGQQKSHLKFQNDDGRQSGKFSISSRRLSPAPLENERRHSTQFHENEERQSIKSQENKGNIKCRDNEPNYQDDKSRRSFKFDDEDYRRSTITSREFQDDQRIQSSKLPSRKFSATFEEDERRSISKFRNDGSRLINVPQEEGRGIYSKCRDEEPTQISKFQHFNSRQSIKYDNGRRSTATLEQDGLTRSTKYLNDGTKLSVASQENGLPIKYKEDEQFTKCKEDDGRRRKSTMSQENIREPTRKSSSFSNIFEKNKSNLNSESPLFNNGLKSALKCSPYCDSANAVNQNFFQPESTAEIKAENIADAEDLINEVSCVPTCKNSMLSENLNNAEMNTPITTISTENQCNSDCFINYRRNTDYIVQMSIISNQKFDIHTESSFTLDLSDNLSCTNSMNSDLSKYSNTSISDLDNVYKSAFLKIEKQCRGYGNYFGKTKSKIKFKPKKLVKSSRSYTCKKGRHKLYQNAGCSTRLNKGTTCRHIGFSNSFTQTRFNVLRSSKEESAYEKKNTNESPENFTKFWKDFRIDDLLRRPDRNEKKDNNNRDVYNKRNRK